MIDPHCSPEVEAIIAYGVSTGVTIKVTSTLRPGAVTISGNLSLHGAGLAVDFAGLVPTRDSSVLADIFHAFVPVEKHLAELIYAGPQVGFNIKNGRRVGKYAQSIHHDHVHVGVRSGVLLDRLVPTINPDAVIEQAPDDHEGEDMAEPMDAIPAPAFGPEACWVVTKDGGLRNYNGAPFWGGFLNLKPENRPANFTFVEIRPGRPDDAGAEGYTIFSSGMNPYHFDSGVWAAIQRGEI